MFVAFLVQQGYIEKSEEGETFEEFVQRLLEEGFPYSDGNLAEVEFAAIIPTEISIKRKEI